MSDFLGDRPSGRPGTDAQRPGQGARPEAGTRPGRPDQGRPGAGDRNEIGDGNRFGDRNEANVGDRQVNIGEVNVGNQVDYSQNRQNWVDNRHATGNRVRANAGNRYVGVHGNRSFRRGVGGYRYDVGWVGRGNYYAWRAPTYAALGGFLGARIASTQPIYYGYGTGGNVYYEGDTVYVDGQAAGAPEEYAEQALEYVEAAPPPDQVEQEEWMPLGVFVMTNEDAVDSGAMLELAVSRQGVLAGTYYNDATEASRPLKGTVDLDSQRAVVGFADETNADVALETGLYNLTQDEAPALLHHGSEQSTPVLLVRLPAPEEGDGA